MAVNNVRTFDERDSDTDDTPSRYKPTTSSEDDIDLDPGVYHRRKLLLRNTPHVVLITAPSLTINQAMRSTKKNSWHDACVLKSILWWKIKPGYWFQNQLDARLSSVNGFSKVRKTLMAPLTNTKLALSLNGFPSHLLLSTKRPLLLLFAIKLSDFYLLFLLN